MKLSTIIVLVTQLMTYASIAVDRAEIILDGQRNNYPITTTPNQHCCHFWSDLFLHIQ